MERRCAHQSQPDTSTSNPSKIHSTSILPVQPRLQEVIELQYERPWFRKERQEARDVFQVGPDDAVAPRRLGRGRAPDLDVLECEDTQAVELGPAPLGLAGVCWVWRVCDAPVRGDGEVQTDSGP